MSIKFKNVKVISLRDWDSLVEETYNRPYSFQQQDGCKDRGIFHFSVPNKEDCDYKNDSIEEEVNGSEMGVSFKSWLERDPKKQVGNRTEDSAIELFWHRNFYPEFQTVANDLNAKGLLPDGEYAIEIDW